MNVSLSASQYNAIVNPQDTFLDFDPNKPGTQEVWAVYGGGRFKTYASRGPALNSVRAYGRSKLYCYNPKQGKWDLIAVLDGNNKPERCEFCAVDLMQYRTRWDYTQRKSVEARDQPKVSTGQFVWVKERGKIPDPPVLKCLCDSCARSASS